MVYVTEAAIWHAEAMVADPYVTQPRLLPVAEVRQLPLPPLDRLFLDAALASTRRVSPTP